MNEFKLPVAAETHCLECEKLISVDAEVCPFCQANAHRMTFGDFFYALEHGRMMDARLGGLVIGRPGPEDDIPMYKHVGGAVFALSGLMQGGEYILSQAATKRYADELATLNAETGDASGIAINVSPRTSVINTNLMPEWGGLWTGHQFIVNRYATARHFDTLERMNAEANEYFAKHPGLARAPTS